MAARKTSVALAKLVPFQNSDVLVCWMLTATPAMLPWASEAVPQRSPAGVPQPAAKVVSL